MRGLPSVSVAVLSTTSVLTAAPPGDVIGIAAWISGDTASVPATRSISLMLAAAIEAVDGGRGVIVLTDLFGGTPSNLAISLMERGRVEVIAGINLPMLIRLESARKAMTVVAAVAAAREAGRKYISVASEVLGEAAA